MVQDGEKMARLRDGNQGEKSRKKKGKKENKDFCFWAIVK